MTSPAPPCAGQLTCDNYPSRNTGSPARDRQIWSVTDVQVEVASSAGDSPVTLPKINYRVAEQPVVQQPVICFDRDKTVDVRPPESGRAVPLAWIQYYAHHTDHDVWATGNPRLCREAGIPSPREARELLADAGRDPVAVYDRMNSGRIDRLRLLDQLYGESYDREVQFVVVDDTDVTEYTEGRPWSYYGPSEFVVAVESGAFPDPDVGAVSGDPYGAPERGDLYRAQLDRFERLLTQ
jgi:hypothetical protein